MPSRQDQLHSYQFVVQRVVAALVMRETDPARSPFRRAAGATLASVLVAAITLGAVALYGLFVGGGATKWRDASVVIVEKESGARYVYRDERLHPVVNYASALLIVGSAKPKTVHVSRRSIDGVPRGVALGIVDAPDSLPDGNRLSGDPWSLCSVPAADGDDDGPRSALLVGRPPAGGRPLGEQAVLARDPAGGLHLLWHNRRHPVSDAAPVLTALGFSDERPVELAPALLNSLEVGAGLGLIDIPARGQRSTALPDARIGEVFVVRTQGGGEQFAVALRGGLAPVTPVQVDLLLADPRTPRLVGRSTLTELGQAAFAGAAKAPPLGRSAAAAPPETTPRLAAAESGAVCGVVTGDDGVREIRVGAGTPDLAGAARTAARSTAGAVLADHVLVEPGRGAVVEAVAAPGAPGGALCVVTDRGRRYAVPDRDVLGVLGYGDVRPLPVPAGLVSLIPAGQALDPAAALVATDN